eukprot:13771-Pyramimonas_sp.AAC.1
MNKYSGSEKWPALGRDEQQQQGGTGGPWKGRGGEMVGGNHNEARFGSREVAGVGARAPLHDGSNAPIRE